jgi:ketopantoate hydroxymethyltransferase
MGKSSGNALQRHTIRVSAVRIPQTDRWTVRSFVSWKSAINSGEETLVHTDLEFGAVEEAMQAGVESAIKWIDDGKQDFLTER